jgi:hypothetical protein
VVISRESTPNLYGCPIQARRWLEWGFDSANNLTTVAPPFSRSLREGGKSNSTGGCLSFEPKQLECIFSYGPTNASTVAPEKVTGEPIAVSSPELKLMS